MVLRKSIWQVLSGKRITHNFWVILARLRHSPETLQQLSEIGRQACLGALALFMGAIAFVVETLIRGLANVTETGVRGLVYSLGLLFEVVLKIHWEWFFSKTGLVVLLILLLLGVAIYVKSFGYPDLAAMPPTLSCALVGGLLGSFLGFTLGFTRGNQVASIAIAWAIFGVFVGVLIGGVLGYVAQVAGTGFKRYLNSIDPG
jgi:hypothetical protein